MTGASTSCFGEQYRDLLLYLHHKLNGNSNRQVVHTAVQQCIQYAIVICSYVASNSVLVADGDTTSSAVSPIRGETPRKDVDMECGTADEMSMPPLKWVCFDLPAPGQSPLWVYAENTRLTASTMNMRCHAKHGNERRSFYYLSSSHQKSFSASEGPLVHANFIAMVASPIGDYQKMPSKSEIKYRQDAVTRGQVEVTTPLRTVTRGEDGVYRVSYQGRTVLWVPEEARELQARLMACAHMQDVGHRGVRATTHRLWAYCAWDNMEKDIAKGICPPVSILRRFKSGRCYATSAGRSSAWYGSG